MKLLKQSPISYSYRKKLASTIYALRHSALLVLSALAAAATVPSTSYSQDVTVYAWGGSNERLEDVIVDRFVEQTGIQVDIIPVEASSSLDFVFARTSAMEAFQLVTMTSGQAYAACNSGFLADALNAGWSIPPLKQSALPRGIGGAVGVSDCAIPISVYALPYAYDVEAYRGQTPPNSLQDFFDVKTYPGARGLQPHPRHTLELALLADGVVEADVYEMLATSEGRERAFNKLDQIRDDVIWWDDFPTLQSVLHSEAVAMTFLWSNWTRDLQAEHNINVVWDQVTAQSEYIGVSPEAVARDDVRQFVELAMNSDIQRDLFYSTYAGSPLELAKCDDDNECCCEGTSTCTEDCCRTRAMSVSEAFWHQYGTTVDNEFREWLSTR